MADVTQQSPRSGRYRDENGNIRNIVDLLGGGTPVSDKIVDPSQQAAKTGRVIGEDGRLYNIVDLLYNLVDLIHRLSIIHRDLGVTTTELYDGATTNPIMIDGVSTTAVEGDLVFYNGEDFVYNHEGVWLSVTSAFGALAYKNSVDYSTNEITNKPTLGTAAAQNIEAFATAAQGTKADDAVPNAGNTQSSAFDLKRSGAVTIESTRNSSEYRSYGNATIIGGYGSENGGSARIVTAKEVSGSGSVSRVLQIQLDENNKGVLMYNGEKIEFIAGTGIQIDHPTASVAISGRTMSVGSINGNLSFTQNGAVLTSDGDVDINPEGDARVTSEEGDVVLKANSSTGKIYAVVNAEDDPEGVTPTADDVVATVGYVGTIVGNINSVLEEVL